MNLKCTCLVIIMGSIAAYFSLSFWRSLSTIAPQPDIEETAWWGPGKPKINENEIIKSFKINVSESVLQDLKSRLDNAQEFQPPLEGVRQQYGMNTKHLKNVVNFWKTKYNWREREKLLNIFPQFTVNIQGLKIHYVHVKPKETEGLKIVPLLLLNGWLSSFIEFYHILPILTEPQKKRKIVFEVIVPSLPGFAFSDAAVRPGLGAVEIAVVLKNFMNCLGFEKYYLQGADWGANIAQNMATLYPNQISGLHSNFCFINSLMSNLKMVIGEYLPWWMLDSKNIKDKIYPLSEKYSYLLQETGYLHIQATKPDTIGVALRDSPVGLAAYMLEKYPLWTNPEWINREDAGLTLKFRLEDLLDNVMIYWVTRCTTTSMRIYSESFTSKYLKMNIDSIPTSVPSACARFAHELIYQPEWVLRDKYTNLIQISDFDDGGHFAAAEVPSVLAEDLYNFVEKVEKVN